ncbi:MAG: PAS domain-containing protein [bacterium]|nr:PAS domain-containing protein [bacterium]
MKKSDYVEATSPQKNTIPVSNVPSEGWYEKLYHMLLGNIPFSLLLIDRTLRVVSANRNFLVKARRSEGATVGGRISEVFPDAILEFTQLEVKIRRVFDTGQALPGAQMTYRAPGVPTRIYYYTVVPVKSGNVVEHAMLVMDDITEKVQLSEKARMAERHLASVIESANDLVISTDAEGRIISWNAAAERISGFRVDAVRGRLLAELCDPAQRDAMTAIIQRLVKGGAVQLQELSLVSRSGGLVPVDWSCSPIRDDSDKVSGVVAVGRDLSERRAFEQHIFQSEKLAALGVMAGGIAHELRNPLSVSFSAAQFLLDSSHDPAFQKECVSKIIDGIQRSSGIIENLLRFARPAPSDQVEAINLVTLVQETVSLLTPQAKIQKIKIFENYPAPFVPISGNASLLQQVIMNLILNAYQAMPAGGQIKIAVRRETAEAVVEVGDTGCGIPHSNMGRVFDPFFTTQPVGKGTGLGLSICHTIVKQHGGVIEVDSVEGQGSTFTVRFFSPPRLTGKP